MNAPSTSGSPAPTSPTPRRSPSGVAAARRARFALIKAERRSFSVFPSLSSPGTNATSPVTSAQTAPSDPFTPNVAHATPSASTETHPTPRSAAMSFVTTSACVGAKPSFSTRHAHPAGTSRHTRVPSACTANDRDPDAPASGCSTTSVRSSRLVTLARVSGSITVAADRGVTNVGGGVTTSPALNGTSVGPEVGSVVSSDVSSVSFASAFVAFSSSPSSSGEGGGGTYTYGSRCAHRIPEELVPIQAPF